MARVLAICPTYNRVNMCHDMIESFLKTAVDNHYHKIELVIGLSENDPQIQNYIVLARSRGVGIFISKSNCITQIINEIYEWAKDFDYYHITNDDVIYRTENWHFIFAMILEQHGGGIIYGNDLLQGENLCTFPTISANVVKAVGWLQYPLLKSLCGDNIWMEIGSKTPCLYYHNQVILEHRHWINNKRPHDKPEYQANFHRDLFVYREFCAKELAGVLSKVRESLNIKPTKMKESESLL